MSNIAMPNYVIDPYCPICGEDLVTDERYPGLLVCPTDDPPHYMEEIKGVAVSET